MATPPLAFSDFRRVCLIPCNERNPPEEALCPICTEEYDRSDHEAMRITVQPPDQCNHEFCRDCLNKIFSRRKTQDNANICPLCRTRWFQSEYESMSARSRRLVNETTNTPPHYSARQPFATPDATASTFTGRDTHAIPPPVHTRRLYARPRQRRPPATQPPTPTRDTQHAYNWRTAPLYLYREVHAAIAAERDAAARTVPQAAPSRPTEFPHLSYPYSEMFQFGQQDSPTSVPSHRPQESSGQPMNNRPAPGLSNYPPGEKDTTHGSQPLPPQEAELQCRAAALDAREVHLTQRERRLERERQELQQRQQEFHALSEHARTFLRKLDAHM